MNLIEVDSGDLLFLSNDRNQLWYIINDKVWTHKNSQYRIPVRKLTVPDVHCVR